MTVTGVGVLDKSVALLDAVERAPSSATELARQLEMTVSTAHRLASALVVHGLLHRDPNGVYRLGSRMSSTGLTEIARQELEQLSAATGETTQVWVRRGDERVSVLTVEPKSELRAVLPVGRTLPLVDGGSAARVLLAPPGAAPPGGWVESVSTRTPGIASVSAPITVEGQLVAALCLVGPVSRLQPGPGVLHGERVVEAADAIGYALAARSALGVPARPSGR